MKYLEYLEQAVGAFVTGVVSFRLGAYQVTVHHADGGPIHLTLAAALLAVTKALAGEAGTFQSGVIEVTLSPLTTGA